MREKWIIVIIGGMLGLSLLFYGINKRSSIMPGDWTQIMILLGLVVVTGAYAWAASRQADASVKMATEMQNQRYDTFRPVLDIGIGPDANTYDSKILLMYTICNVGFGPAFDVYTLTPDLKRSCLGTLTSVRTSEGILDRTSDHTNIERKKLLAMIIAYYKDVYGRCFESKMEIRLAEDEEKVVSGTFEHRKLDKNRDKNLIIDIWPP